MSFCLEVVYFLPIISYYFDFCIIFDWEGHYRGGLHLTLADRVSLVVFYPIREWVRCTLRVRFPVRVFLPILGAKDDVLGFPTSVIYLNDTAVLILNGLGGREWKSVYWFLIYHNSVVKKIFVTDEFSPLCM